MQISTQSRKRLLFAALFLAILVPLFFTLEIRSQLPLLGFEGGSPLIDWVHQNTTGSGFLRKVTGDATFYSLVLLAKDSRLGALLFFQSIVCAAIALVLLWVTLYCKKSYLTPFTIAYTILSALIYLATMGDYAINSQAEEYCVLIREVFDEYRQVLGAEKIRTILVQRGHQVSTEYVAKLMREMELSSIRTTAKQDYLKLHEPEKKKNILRQQIGQIKFGSVMLLVLS